VPALGRDCPEAQRIGDVQRFIDENDTIRSRRSFSCRPCPMQVLKLRAAAPTSEPLCVVVQYAAASSPRVTRRSRRSIASALFTVLNWINDPLYVKARTSSCWCRARRSEINRRILALPTSQQVEIALPTEPERERFRHALHRHRVRPVRVCDTQAGFVADTAGSG